MLKCLGIIALACAGLTSVVSAETGVDVSYRLPNDGDLPRTYLVTVAITDKQNTDGIISTFVAGQPRTVTHENGSEKSHPQAGLESGLFSHLQRRLCSFQNWSHFESSRGTTLATQIFKPTFSVRYIRQ